MREHKYLQEGDTEREEVAGPVGIQYDTAPWQYLQLAYWLRSHGNWAAVTQIAIALGWDCRQVHSAMALLRKKYPEHYLERRERRGCVWTTSIALSVTWRPPEVTPAHVSPVLPLYGVTRGSDVLLPQPMSQAHCCWLQLTQRPWHTMRLQHEEVVQMVGLIRRRSSGVVVEVEPGIQDLNALDDTDEGNVFPESCRPPRTRRSRKPMARPR